jgi:hypothetical protein
MAGSSSPASSSQRTVHAGQAPRRLLARKPPGALPGALAEALAVLPWSATGATGALPGALPVVLPATGAAGALPVPSPDFGSAPWGVGKNSVMPSASGARAISAAAGERGAGWRSGRPASLLTLEMTRLLAPVCRVISRHGVLAASSSRTFWRTGSGVRDAIQEPPQLREEPAQGIQWTWEDGEEDAVPERATDEAEVDADADLDPARHISGPPRPRRRPIGTGAAG